MTGSHGDRRLVDAPWTKQRDELRCASPEDNQSWLRVIGDTEEECGGKAPRVDRRRTGPGIRQLRLSYYRDAKGNNMRNLSKRLDGLEATLAPEGKPFMIWAMINGQP